jgi:hypothetical protein
MTYSHSAPLTTWTLTFAQTSTEYPRCLNHPHQATMCFEPGKVAVQDVWQVWFWGLWRSTPRGGGAARGRRADADTSNPEGLVQREGHLHDPRERCLRGDLWEAAMQMPHEDHHQAARPWHVSADAAAGMCPATLLHSLPCVIAKLRTLLPAVGGASGRLLASPCLLRVAALGSHVAPCSCDRRLHLKASSANLQLRTCASVLIYSICTCLTQLLVARLLIKL